MPIFTLDNLIHKLLRVYATLMVLTKSFLFLGYFDFSIFTRH
jgi:hypothetical protein